MIEIPHPKLSIVLSTHAAQFEAVAYKGDFEANVAKIADWGYAGIELAVRDPDLLQVEAIQKTIARYGLCVPAIGTGQAWGEEHLSFTDPDVFVRNAAVERIKRQILLAEQLEAIVIIGLIRGVTPAGQSKAQSIQYLEQNLADCLETASQHGVRLAIEPLNRYETDLIHTAKEGLELLQRIGLSNLGLLLDTFHMNIEETSIENAIRNSSDHIFHFHVADSNRSYPGSAHLDFSSILDVLISTGYQGWISGEFMPLPDSDTASKRNISYLRSILNGKKSIND